MLTDWNFWLSVVTAIVAIAALMQTKQQIKVSNKQHLFDKRMEHYLIAKGLIQLYESNKIIFKKNEPVLDIASIFNQMTNNSYLVKITDAIAHPLEQPHHKEILVKLETLKMVSAKIKFIFDGEEAILLGNYVLRYQELLFEMYRYQILLENMNKVAHESKLTIEEAQERVKEKDYRENLQKGIENLKQAYDEMKKEKTIKKIERQIKLK